MGDLQKNPPKQWKNMSHKEKRDVLIVLSILSMIPLGIIIGFGEAIFAIVLGWALYLTFKIIRKDASLIYKGFAVFGVLIALSFTANLLDSPDSGNTQKASNEKDAMSIIDNPAEKQSVEQEEKLNKQLYEVVSIVDGDTIKISFEGKTESLRLIGIDTPETNHPNKPVECFGKAATEYLTELISGKKVQLEEDGSQSSRDKYDRLLRYVFLENGTNVNEKMIHDGYAFEYTYDSNSYKYQKQFKDAESNARINGRGLWASNTCNGERKPAESTQPAAAKPQSQSQSTTPKPQPQPTTASGSVVKKSTNDICHEPGTTYYSRTKNYTAYNSIQECLNSGGRLPKR